MPRYKCTNEKCSRYEMNTLFEKVRLVWNADKQEYLPSEPILCRECKGDMEFIKPEGEITCTFSKFSLMTPEQRKEAMHKRSQAHFRKTDKGDLDNYKKTLTQGLRNKAIGGL